MLMRPRRQILEADEARIRDRVLHGQDEVRAVAFAFATERGFSKGIQYWLARIGRLVLAIRDADGETLVTADVLDDLPRFDKHMTEILRRAGMLGPRRVALPITTKDTSVARGCIDCGCWGIHAYPRCRPCQSWKFSLRHPIGPCSRCRRTKSPVRADGLCRGCSVHIAEHGPDATGQRGTQLWFGGQFALKLRHRAGYLGADLPGYRARRRTAADRPQARLSPHLVDPRQDELFEVRRDWSCIAAGSLDQLPALAPSAKALMTELDRYARSRHWEDALRGLVARSLRIVLAWIGADAPIHEADVRSLPSDRPGTNARRAVEFLASRAMLIPDPDRRVGTHERVLEQRIQALPAGLADELRRWAQVLRGEGRRPHPARSFETIRKYLGYAYPVLQHWSNEYDSLREITPQHIDSAMHGLIGHPAADRLTALRSIFRALKQERVIFRDPTRGFTVAAIVRLPASISTDRLRGLIDRADGPLAKLVVALIAIHALGKREVTELKLADLDRACGTLIVRRRGGRHVVYLDELTLQLALAWLRERHRRWPAASNPYLLISEQSADMVSEPPVSSHVIDVIFRPLGVRPSALRQDRILDEARHTADPVHLMRIFGISVTTAMDYVHAAHPERRSTLPR
ncbi:hypothetical protein [Amycolatopsis sp. RTGN1]|uniref:hypothetical protein n=1 Tax=Amycolatopsis ponsaeliensis TaxID=2992142 RepID=UPI00254FF447|nr:hypothetical protein [Amycolatopsis sp. RTGN1]